MNKFLYDNTLSKSREGSKSYSRNSFFHEYDQNHIPQGLINGSRTVGSKTVDQTRIGVHYPSVQSAIDDLANSMVIPVNGILETTEDLSPAGNPAVERVTITGISSNDHVFLYGYKIPVIEGDDNDQVTTKVLNFFNSLVSNDEVFNSVTQITTNVLEFEFIDTRPHEEVNYNINGVTFLGETVVDARAGFGTWLKLGEYEKFTGVTVYAWKRTS